ncbi:vacuolar ATPase assembly integral membrane protein VMA21 homolog [Lycorma delicatula]|uniref:vacuolar ATPase assembly integral membrane protein VMA21 homolog n=1 Tax=Lycorma delicatula TaxID=130591 RepID=UPI003F50E70D
MNEPRIGPDIPDFVVFRSVFYYCFMIIVVPVITFFGTKFIIFDGIFRLASVSSSVYAAIVSIIALHIALGLYIYKAYHETGTGTKPAKQD